MKGIIRYYNNFLNIILLAIPLLYMMNHGQNSFILIIVNILSIAFFIFTVYMTLYKNRVTKMYYECIFLLLFMSGIIMFYFFINQRVTLEDALSSIFVIALPLLFFIIGKLKVSNTFIVFVSYILLFTEFILYGKIDEISAFIVLIVINSLIMCREELISLRICCLLFSWLSLLLMIESTIISSSLIVLVSLLFYLRLDKCDYSKMYLLTYFIFAALILLEVYSVDLPSSIFLGLLVLRICRYEKLDLLFIIEEAGSSEKRRATINFFNNINYNKYDVSMMIKGSNGSLLDNINKEVYIKKYNSIYIRNRTLNSILNKFKLLFYTLMNYNSYAFSCCYGKCSKYVMDICRISSSNSCFYFLDSYLNDVDEFNKIFFTSNELKDEYIKMYPMKEDKCYVINNYIEIHDIKMIREKTTKYKPRGYKLLIYIGDLDEEKTNFSMVVDTIKEIPKTILWIIGDGKDKDTYLKMIKKYDIKDRVNYLGDIQDPYEYMTKADYVVMAPVFNTFSIVFLEAMSLKKEIITTSRFSDGDIDTKKYSHIVSKENYIEDVREIIKYGKIKSEKINFKAIQYSRSKKLENLFEGGTQW